MKLEDNPQQETDIFQQAIGLAKENQRLAKERELAEEQVISLAKFSSENPNPVLRIGKDKNLLYANLPALPLLNNILLNGKTAKTGDHVPLEFQKMVHHALFTQSIQQSEIKVGTQTFQLEWMPILSEGYVNVYGRDITERKQAEAKNLLHYELTGIFLDGQSLERTIPKILQAVGEFMQWEISNYWELNPQSEELRCKYSWNAGYLNDNPAFKELKTNTFKRIFSKGEGLPGRIWDNLEPFWVPDVCTDKNFPRAPFANNLGMTAGFGFPIFSNNQFTGVIEIFTCNQRSPDDHLIQFMTSLGEQIGQWMHLKKAEELLKKLNLEILE
jgi:hypothetical protein